jgi:hypothetical protein
VKGHIDLFKWLIDSAIALVSGLMEADSWAEVGNFLAEFFAGIGGDIYTFFAGLVNSFVSFVTSLPGKLIAFVKNAVSGVGDIIKGIPFIGSLFGDDSGGKPLVTPGPGFSIDEILPMPTSGARAAGASINNSASNTTNSNRQSNQFNITQAPGESGEGLASRIASELQKSSALAVAVNSSGIEV